MLPILLTLLLLLLFAAAPLTHAADLLFYRTGHCSNQKADYMICTSPGDGRCCMTLAPFTAVLACRNCDGKHLLPSWGVGDCSGYNVGACMEDDAQGVHCCMELGSNATCSGKFLDRPKGMALGLDESDGPCENPQTPDVLSYIDPDDPDQMRQVLKMGPKEFAHVVAAYSEGNYTMLKIMQKVAVYI